MDFTPLLSYVRHWLTCVDRHSLQAPFLYSFYDKVIKGPKGDGSLELFRASLLKSDKTIKTTDFGAGSKVQSGTERKISKIAKYGVCGSKEGDFLRNLAVFLQAKHILELGTSLGLGSMYLASSSEETKVTTFEGCPEIAAEAERNFLKMGYGNIELMSGDIDKTLPDFLGKTKSPDLVFLDANHTYEATLRYFRMLLPVVTEKTTLVFDDIHWSKGMERAWNEISKSEEVGLALDLYHVGVVFFRKDLQPFSFPIKM
ncbi:O-methyltransferase [Fulvitalea axinellae]|uniref:O-methyltransferase n=1 Tax=Fulvitalea axinellae TaxID=1182444 RepID=A0AAU9CJV1_9BACT|nr:O-methyltransferase [Fulvitalea axinellae]